MSVWLVWEITLGAVGARKDLRAIFATEEMARAFVAEQVERGHTPQTFDIAQWFVIGGEA
jgi:hypothetical protein